MCHWRTYTWEPSSTTNLALRGERVVLVRVERKPLEGPRKGGGGIFF